MTVVGFVPARGGSVRVPRKNLAIVGHETLVERAVGSAFDAGCDRVVVSTDDDMIAAAVSEWSPVTVERTFRHTSTTQIEEAIAHWLRRDSLAPDDVILLHQPTSPLRRAETSRRCVELVRDHGYDSALAVHLDKREPFRGGRCHVLEERDGVPTLVRALWDRPHGWKRPRSQDVRYAPEETGSAYAFAVRHFRETRSRMGGREACVPVDWLEALEIDEPADLLLANILAPHVERLREAA